MSIETAQLSKESMDVDNDNSSNNTQSIESNGNGKNSNIDNNNNDIELSSTPSTSTQQNKLIDKSSTIINHNIDNKNLKEDIDDNIVLKKPMNIDSSSSSSSSSPSPNNLNNPNNNDTETKENDDNNDSHNLSTSYPLNTKIRKIRKIGVSENGELMPGFEVVNDDQLAFSSESDFAIFINQISSEIPLQRV